MKLVDLKRTKDDKKAIEDLYAPDGPPEEDYSYSLSISLGDEELDKLGISKLEPGTEVLVTAVAKVRSFSEDENEKKTTRRAELMLQKMDITQSSGDPSKVLYGGSDGE